MKKLLIALSIAVLMVSCSKEKAEVKTIEKRQEENGVPVKVITSAKTNLINWETYTSTLRGSSEVNVVPSLGDRLERLYVKVGDYVRKDQVIAKFEYDNMQAQNVQAKVNYENMKTMYERMKNVYEAGSISKQDFDNVTVQYEVAKQNYLSTSDLINIKAPISGYVTDVYITDDRKILDPQRDAICRISNTKSLKANIFIDEKTINNVKKGDAVIVKWVGKEYNAKIAKLSLSSTEEVRGFSAEVSIPNTKNELKSGVFVDILIQTANKENVFVVKNQSIIKDEEGNSFIFIANGNKVEKRAVKLGETDGLNVEITEGLNEGESVVVEGAKFLEDGLNIKIIE